MPGGSCSVCKTGKDGWNMHHVPKDLQKRKAWSKACGINFLPSSRVCRKHFLDSDFNDSTTTERMRLKGHIIPTLFLNNSRSKLSVNKKSKKIIKTNVKSSKNFSIEFINEELFDKAGTSVESPEEDGPIKAEELEIDKETDEQMQEYMETDEDVDEHTESIETLDSEEMISKTEYIETEETITMTAKQTIRSLRRTCGIIEVTLDNQIYIMSCFHCNEEFPLWSWSKFVLHLKEAHQGNEPLSKKKAVPAHDSLQESEELPSNKEENDIDLPKDSPASVPVLANIKLPSCIQMKLIVPESTIVKIEELPKPSEFVATNDASKELFEPNMTVENSGNTQNVFEYDDDNDNDDVNEDDDDFQMEMTNKTREIKFGQTEPVIVEDFLELVKSHPILWYFRQPKTAENYDAALDVLTEQINTKWQLTLTAETTQKSINRIKDWYRRLIKVRKLHQENQMDYSFKYESYYEKCAEFLPNEVPIFQCELCTAPFMFRSQLLLKAHMYKVHKIGELPYKCRQCDVNFETWLALNTHKETEHKKPPKEENFFCKECNKGFKYESYLQRHMVVHVENGIKSCEICDKTFPTLKNYRSHMIRHETPTLKCTLCDSVFHRPWRLKVHMKSHLGQRDHQCDQCGKSFMRSTTLSEHKLSKHFGRKGVKCPICDKVFRYYCSLYDHRKKEHLVLEGTIEELNKFGKNAPVSKYKSVVNPLTNETRYACDVCPNTYRYPQGVRRHKELDHGIKPVRQRRSRLKKKSLVEVSALHLGADDEAVSQANEEQASAAAQLELEQLYEETCIEVVEEPYDNIADNNPDGNEWNESLEDYSHLIESDYDESDDS